MPRFGVRLALWLALALVPAVARAQGVGGDESEDAAKIRALRAAANAAFDAKDYAKASEAAAGLAELLPRDAFVQYNLACALSMAGNLPAAEAALEEAFAKGFIDLFHMTRDEHLAPMRETRTYRLLVEGWADLVDARGKADLAGLRARFRAGSPPEAYAFVSDEGLRLHFASAFRASSFEDARAQIVRVNAWAARELFPAVEKSEAKARPDAWVSVILPTPQDFFRLVFADGVGGYYDRDRRRLVTQDIGPSLRHEFFHVLHWRFTERMGQRHPLWIMEGLACLFEDVDMPGAAESGGFVFKPSWRTNIVRRVTRAGSLMNLERFCSLADEKFMSERPRFNYAQARAVFMFLESEGKLSEWFAGYVKGYAEDASGRKALERAFDLPLAKIDAKFRAWSVRLPEVAEQSKPARFGLGVSVSGGRGDGVVIDRVVTGSRLTRGIDNPLRFKDVIVEIDKKPVRTLDDYVRVLGELQPEEPPERPPLAKPPPGVSDPFAERSAATAGKVKVKVRRASKEMEVEVMLVEIPEDFAQF